MRLAGGPTPADAAAIYTGGGRLALRAVTVDSFDPTTRQAMPAGPGRPFIVVSGGGRFEAVDSAIDDLGTVPTDPAPRAGLTLGETSTGSLVHTTLRRNSHRPQARPHRRGAARGRDRVGVGCRRSRAAG